MPAIILPDRLDITAEELGAKLRTRTRGRTLVLDGGLVTRTDATGLQLVCAAVVHADGKVMWLSASDTLRADVHTLGLDAVLGFTPKETL